MRDVNIKRLAYEYTASQRHKKENEGKQAKKTTNFLPGDKWEQVKVALFLLNFKMLDKINTDPYIITIRTLIKYQANEREAEKRAVLPSFPSLHGID